MRIRWDRVVALMLAVVVLVLVARHGTEMGVFLGTMQYIGRSEEREEQMMGFIAFGLVMVLIVALVRILKDNNK